MPKRLKIILLACGFAVVGTISGFGLAYLFPQLEQVLLKGQSVFLSGRPEVSRLVMVTPPSGTNRVCPQGRWHPSEFEAMILAMHQAGASVVASLEDFSRSSGSSCGDLGSFARLAETTKRVGNVLYPESASAMLHQAAAGVGHVSLPSPKDSPLMNVTFPSPIDSDTILPIGLAAAALVMSREHSFTALPETGGRLFFSSSPSPDFPVQSFETVKNLWKAGEIDRLTQLFQEKIVLVSAGDLSEPLSSGVGDVPSTIAFLHAQLVHTALTRSWLSMVPIGVAVAMTMLLACILAFYMLQPRQTTYFMWSVLAGFLVSLVVLAMLPHTGWLWPLAGTIMSMSFTAGGGLDLEDAPFPGRLSSTDS